MLRVLVSTPKLNLDHMLMALLVLWVLNLWIWLQNKLVNCQSTNLLRDKLRLCLNPPKWRVYSLCNRWTRRVTSNPDGIEKRVKIIERVGIRMRMWTIMTRMVEMLGGTSKLNIRLSSLASCLGVEWEERQLQFCFPDNGVRFHTQFVLCLVLENYILSIDMNFKYISFYSKLYYACVPNIFPICMLWFSINCSLIKEWKKIIDRIILVIFSVNLCLGFHTQIRLDLMFI